MNSLSTRCAELAAPVTSLTSAIFSAQTQSAVAFQQTIEAAESILLVVGKGDAGIDSDEYAHWASNARPLLEEIIEAARQGDYQRLWSAFTDPDRGFHHLGVACAGEPKWANPQG